MIDAQLMAFTAIAAVLAFTPGADTLLVIKNSVRNGAGGGWATAVGVLSGTLFHAMISALGLSVIIAQSDPLFQSLKGLGALYLVWLGIQTLRSGGAGAGEEESHGTKALTECFQEGLVTNLLNPKVAIFYIALLPQFINPGDSVLAKSILLASIHNGLSLLWLGGLAAAIGRGRAWVQQKRVRDWLARISGVVLIGLGIRLALESN